MNVPSHGVIHFYNWKQSYIPEILHEIYIQKVYLPYIGNLKDATFLDLGLNIGLWSLYASQFAKQIYSFEPSKQTFDIAVQNLKDNGIMNVKAINKAIAEKDGTQTFFYSQNTTMNSLNPHVKDTDKKEEVETIRLDTFVKQEGITHIDFAKIDIEGTEDIVFMSDSFKNIAPILDCFVYEWHGWANANPYLINDGLHALGYRIRPIPSQTTLFVCDKR